MQGSEVATATVAFCWVFGCEGASYIWDRDSRHIEAYLNGCMCAFVLHGLMFIRA